MLIFGIVLMWNRRKRRARAPRTTVPLTADMLNELDKSHMAGVDNYGVEDVYDPDDAWNNEKVTYDRRLRSASRARNDDTKNYNIYDSWRSDYSGAHGSAAGWSRNKIENFDDDPDDF
ncbi:uncharacterized protein LOC122386852 [Amphibalanus amphitrite]|nr:uncharacterized protein LOC122386852 [Amphibalanus amphitrite]